MIIFALALVAFALLAGWVDYKLNKVKTGGELGKARRAVAAAARPVSTRHEFGDFSEEWK